MARLWDLWPFVKKHVYHPQFQGSFSLKAVLPGLAPGFSYEGMEVSHGDEAGLAQRGPANDLTILGHLTTRRQDIFTAPVQPAQLATRVLCYRHPQTQRAPHSRSHISQCPSHMNPASNAGLVRISQPRDWWKFGLFFAPRGECLPEHGFRPEPVFSIRSDRTAAIQPQLVRIGGNFVFSWPDNLLHGSFGNAGLSFLRTPQMTRGAGCL
jgi:hypothetical protein